ncbi:hypothetical protein ACG91D_12360 [Acinetobacter guillouiae]|uniref:hypothetical protein n=1 Tax=Acinetobacter guillouiae TaxID=106649 RepID=UPI003AF64B9E
MAKAKGFLDELLSNFKQKSKETFNEFLEQSKDTVKTTAHNLVEDSTKKLKDVANEKFSDVANNFVGKDNVNKENSLVLEEDKLIKPKKNQQTPKDNGEKFEKDLHNSFLGVAQSLATANPKEALEAVNNFVSMAGEVAKFTEVQKTTRKQIEAERDIAVNSIQAQKNIILVYLEKSFDERKENFERLFSIVDDAITKNNKEQLALGLNSINQLANSSPFKALTSVETTQAALMDKDHTWDF